MGTRYIHLIRHGQYHMAEGHKSKGSLTPLGKQQARAIKKRVSKLEVSNIYSSTLKRAEETAKIVGEGFPQKRIKKNSLLVEGIPSMTPMLVRKHNLKSSHMQKTKTRMNKAFKKYFTPFKGIGEKHDILVCHGNLIRYFTLKAIGLNTEKWIQLDIFQCSLTTIAITDKGALKLIHYGDSGHIPLHKQTLL